MQLSEIQDECGRLLGDPDHTRWSLETLRLRSNKAQTEIQGLTNAVKYQLNQDVSAQGNIELTGISGFTGEILDILWIHLIRADGTYKELKIKSEEWLDSKIPGWRNLSFDEPEYCIFYATNQSTPYLRTVPQPGNTDYSAAFYASVIPDDLTDPTDVPFNNYTKMYPYHYSVVHWVVSYCWMDDGTPESFAKSKFYMSGDMDKPGQYENQIKRINSEFDVLSGLDDTLLWQPQGGRLGGTKWPTKSNPLA